MSQSFAPRLDILPEAQRRLWVELREVPAQFVLYGGTALALHLGHRVSVDFDFFTSDGFDPGLLYARLPFLKGATIVRQEPNTLTCLVDRGSPVQVSFFSVPNIARVDDPHVSPDNGLRVASLLDLAGTKVELVQRRAHAKDYLDIDALIAAGIDLPTALAAARAVHGASFHPTPTLKALSYFGDGDLGTLPEAVTRRLVEASRVVDPLRLPSLKRAKPQDRGEKA